MAAKSECENKKNVERIVLTRSVRVRMSTFIQRAADRATENLQSSFTSFTRSRHGRGGAEACPLACGALFQLFVNALDIRARVGHVVGVVLVRQLQTGQRLVD